MLLCLGYVSPALAQPPNTQFSMDRQIDAGEVTLNYSFNDLDDISHQLSVAFPHAELIQQPILFRPLSQARLLREIADLQRQFANQQGWRDAQIDIRHNGLNYQFHQGSLDERQRRTQVWQNNYQQAYQQVIHRNYYQSLEQHAGRSGYAPDHVRIAQESVTMLAPLSEALKLRLQQQSEEHSPREALAFVVHFIQQIPYNDFTDRLQSPGAGFIPPGRLLYENKGDCDSKVTLLAALMKNLYPDVESRIVYLPGHAVFAFELEPESQDIYLHDNGATFVIADPTGPALLAVGEASNQYQSHLRSGAVTMKAF